MSMSIPFMFEEIEWQSEWGTYLGGDMTGSIVVDGGLLSDFPLRLLLPGASPEIQRFMGPPPPDHAELLGLMIDPSIPVPDAPDSVASPGERLIRRLVGKTRLGQRIARVVNTGLDGNDLTYELLHTDLVCRLPAGGYDATEFYMSDARIRALLAGGHAALDAYLRARPPGPCRDANELPESI
jgi:hypothetical protein